MRAHETSAAAGASWEALRDQTLIDLDALIQVAADARRDLRAFQSTLEKNRRHLARGGRVAETPGLFDIRVVRATLTDGLNDLERARNVARLALWRLQLAEGTTIAEIARVWGFSRQLVSRALVGGTTRATRGARADT